METPFVAVTVSEELLNTVKEKGKGKDLAASVVIAPSAIEKTKNKKNNQVSQFRNLFMGSN